MRLMRFVPLLLLSATPLGAQQGVLLRYAPPEGQVSVYRIATTSEVDLPTGSHMSVEQVMHMTQRVVARDDDVATVEMVVDSVSMTGPVGMMGGGATERFEGTRSTVRIDSRGRVLGVEYDDSLLQRIAGSFTGQLAGGSPGQVLFAERPVTPGAAWSDSGTTTIPTDAGRMEMWRNLTYRLERLEARGQARVAVISVTGTIRQVVTLEDTGATPALTSEGTMQGQISYDLDASRWEGHEMVMIMVTESATLPAPMQMTITARAGLVTKD